MSANPTLPADISAAKRALLEARLRGQHRPAGLVRRPPGSEAPLSFAQERLWFLHRLDPGGAAYNLPSALRLPDGVDAAALERALGEIVRRHETLRTVFAEADGVPVQRVLPFAGFSLVVEDLSGVGDGERDARVRERVAEHAARPFDLSAGPVFRASLLRLGADGDLLLLCMHHIAGDGWSTRVMQRELWAAYGAALQGRPSPLPEPPVQYADYAAWQRDPAQRQAEGRHLAYWRERLAGAPELLELPADHPRPPVPSYRGGTVPVHASAEVLAGLRDVARAEGATLFMVVLAAFGALLGRWAGTPDVVVGSPVAGRTRRETEGLIGCFVNTLVLRTDLSGDPTFREAVRVAREAVLGAYEHQDVAFERLVAELQPGRTLSHASLFQVMFMLDEAAAPTAGPSAPSPAGPSAAPRTEGAHHGLEATKFDLTLSLDAHAGGLGGVLSYATDLFERGTMARMAEHLGRVLAQAAAHPDRRLSALRPMGQAERARVLTEWSGTDPVAAAGPPLLHRRFQAQAARTPRAVALAWDDGELSYAGLNARADRLAHRLMGMGVGPEARVGLCLQRGPAMVVALLAVLKAGGAYVPLDPGYPAERLAFMLADSAVAVLLTESKLAAALPVPAGVRTLCIDADLDSGRGIDSDIGRGTGADIGSGRGIDSDIGRGTGADIGSGRGIGIDRDGGIAIDRAAVDGERGDAPRVDVSPHDLAYVIYTSGSTGRPKGVAVHHGAVAAYLDWAAGAYPADSSAVHTPLSFDLTVTSLFVPLLCGGRVELVEEASPVEGLARRLERGGAYATLKLTPTHLRILGEQLEGKGMMGGAECLVVGGEALLGADVDFWRRALPGARIVNEYGPTEAAVGCCTHAAALGEVGDGAMPIGRPAPGTRLYVLDAEMEPTPQGVAGELYIGGAQLARGYLNRPALTAERFVPDPFGDGAGERLYRSGDRARWRPDGVLEYLGRVDEQVKIRGFRIEPGEVEAALRLHPGVAECVVMAREDRPGDRRLVAYAAGAVDGEALRAHLRAALPEHMVPSAFVVMDALPMTPNGKLDRRALPAPETRADAAELEEPRGFLEVRLLRIWEELLGVSPIGPTQDFFALGGSSLMALRLFARVNRALECDLPVSTLFAGATVRQMADAVRAQKQAPAAPPAAAVALQADGTLPPVFCVHAADRGVHGYVNLVRHLGADQPVYGLRDLGDDLSRPVATIAAEYVAAVRGVQPSGPYHLAGWSFGGFVAFEMALQLQAAGQAVAFVGLLDSLAPDVAQSAPWRRDADVATGIARDVAGLARRPFHIDAEPLDGLPLDEIVRRVVEALHAQGAAPATFSAEALRQGCGLMRDRNRSLDGYVPGRFGGTLTLFRAMDVPDLLVNLLAPLTPEERRTRGWCRHTPHPVQVVDVPGAHATLGSEPHVRVLAERFREALAAARARG